MGLEFTRTTDDWQWDFAYFFQSELEAAFGTGGSPLSPPFQGGNYL